MNRRQLEEDDVCPICQEELLEVRLPVTWCRACSNAAHIRCMKVWAEHQETMNRGDNGAPVLCPYCRQVNFEIPYEWKSCYLKTLSSFNPHAVGIRNFKLRKVNNSKLTQG